MINLDTVFKAYDIRGIYPSQLNEEFAIRVGEAFAAAQKPKIVAVGRDVRTSGESLKKALIDGLLSAGIDVVDIGVITTDQLYFTVGHYGYDGGISVTASHNPAEYNGFKFSVKGGAPPSPEDLAELRNQAEITQEKAEIFGSLSHRDILKDYVKHVLGFINTNNIKPLNIVANANFGAVGRGVDLITDELGLKLSRLNWTEDGTFPKGPPNPLLPENRDETIELIKHERPDFGVAWDADADRVFFFTGTGQFIPSCYIVALLAREFLKTKPGSKIIYDLTTAWVIKDAIKNSGGIPVANRTGHTFIKRRMREEKAIFAGESSGHFYFQENFYADNGLVPFLTIIELTSRTGKSLDELVKPLMNAYKVSGEINFEVQDTESSIKRIEDKFASMGQADKTDGLVIEAPEWRFSLRPSNTEPLLRLNAESRNKKILDQLLSELTELIKD